MFAPAVRAVESPHALMFSNSLSGQSIILMVSQNPMLLVCNIIIMYHFDHCGVAYATPHTLCPRRRSHHGQTTYMLPVAQGCAVKGSRGLTSVWLHMQIYKFQFTFFKEDGVNGTMNERGRSTTHRPSLAR
jgi:hypothetical protein